MIYLLVDVVVGGVVVVDVVVEVLVVVDVVVEVARKSNIKYCISKIFYNNSCSEINYNTLK